jgi:hypothetical protein
MIISQIPLRDGALSHKQPGAAEMVEAMAKVLVDYGAFTEGAAIGKLSGRGYSYGQIIKHVDAAIARAKTIAGCA